MSILTISTCGQSLDLLVYEGAEIILRDAAPFVLDLSDIVLEQCITVAVCDDTMEMCTVIAADIPPDAIRTRETELIITRASEPIFERLTP